MITQDEAVEISDNYIVSRSKRNVKVESISIAEKTDTNTREKRQKWEIIYSIAEDIGEDPSIIVVLVDVETGEPKLFPMI